MTIKPQHIASTYGCIAGLSMIIFTMVLYRAGVNVFLGWIAYLGYAILIGLSIAATLAARRAGDGYLPFREALKVSFTVFVIALAAQSLFTWLLLNFFDLHFKQALTQGNLEKSEAFLRKLGMPDDKVDQELATEKSKDQFSFGLMTFGLAISYIVHFIVALIIAALVKKKQPVFKDAGI
jgi:Protein of unknown function (DUF4199)